MSIEENIPIITVSKNKKANIYSLTLFVILFQLAKIQIGVSCCRACSITAYQRYASGSSGDYSMGKTLNENETMFKVCLANGKCEEFKPYNLNEISIIFRTMAIRNPYDVHPV